MTSTPSSHSEGEILTSDSEKASQTLPSRNDISVDRHSRTDAFSLRNPRSRSRSPYRPPRGEKRRRDDGNVDGPVGSGPRSQRAKHENERHLSDRGRGRWPHAGSGLKSRRRSQHAYDREVDHYYSSKPRITRSRSRSRSPFRHSRLEAKNGRGASPDRSKLEESEQKARPSRAGGIPIDEQSVSERGKSPGVAVASKLNAKTSKIQSSQVESTNTSDSVVNGLKTDASTGDEPDTSALANVVDEASLIEERRRRREALKAKYRSQETPLLVRALHPVTEIKSPASSSTHPPDNVGKSTVARASGRNESAFPTDQGELASPQTPNENFHSPDEFSFEQGENLANPNSGSIGCDDEEPSAADYDPTADMQEERARHDKRLFKEDISMSTDEAKRVLEPGECGGEASSPTTKQCPPGESKKQKDPFDMFADDDDDADGMFGETAPKSGKATLGTDAKTAQSLDVTMMDNWDDSEGYYMTIPGELFESRYHVLQNLGRGMFSSVVRATDTKTNKLVAIKIVRNNDTMRKAGVKEIEILKELAANDPEDRKHVIRLERSFEHKGHLCMVFENLSLNLREVLKKFGRDVGINLKAIRAYAQQLFLGLSLLRKCRYVHADLKPDNILVNEARNVLKMCDLGSASSIEENATAPYLVSRFYRAPEIILGVPYDYAIDVWSVGCTLFELYTGKILFTGRNNNAMLRSIMECRGKFPHRVLRKGSLTYQYFDDLLNFHAIEEDRLTGRRVRKMIEVKPKPVRGLRERLVPKGRRMDEQERKEVELFADLLDKCLDLRGDKRITPSEALRHPFIARSKV